jgi:hypothetical protein
LIFPALGHLFERTTVNVTVFGFLPVVPMVLGSAVCMFVVSLLTVPPGEQTIAKYFPNQKCEPGSADIPNRPTSTDIPADRLVS